MSRYFPAGGATADYCSNPAMYDRVNTDAASLLPVELIAKLDQTGRVPLAGDVKYIFCTKCGPGPLRQPAEESLLDPASGMPVPPSARHKRLVISHRG